MSNISQFFAGSRKKNRRIFHGSVGVTTVTWLVPPGVTEVEVHCWGAGGRGGGSAPLGGGGGGGGGANSEGLARLDGYDLFPGTYADGTTYELRAPRYVFEGANPQFFSVRNAPPLIATGLLEAIDEAESPRLASEAGRGPRGACGGELDRFSIEIGSESVNTAP